MRRASHCRRGHLLERRGPNGTAHCRECHARRAREFRANRSAASLELARAAGRRHANKRNRSNRLAVVAAYGGVCACCGEANEVFLCLDHIGGGGNEHRRSLGGSSAKVYTAVIAAGFPKSYQLLCHNCNFATARGACPHAG